MDLDGLARANSAAVYARVSTLGQADNTSIATQVDRCTARARADGYGHVYECLDVGVSGGQISRPGLADALELGQAGKISVIYVATPDRLSRDIRQLGVLVDLFAAPGVPVTFLDFGSSPTATSAEKLMWQTAGAIAEFERTVIREQLVAGKVATAAKGYWPGGRPPYGYALHRTRGPTRLVVHPDEAQLVGHLHDLIVRRGLLLEDVADLLNQSATRPRRAAGWTAGQIRKLVDSSGRAWSGRWLWHPPDGTQAEPVPVETQPLLDQRQHGELATALTTIPRRVELAARYPLRYILSSRHEAPMLAVTVRGRRRYRCSWRRTAERPTGQPQCDCVTTDADQAEAEVWRLVVTAARQAAHRRPRPRSGGTPTLAVNAVTQGLSDGQTQPRFDLERCTGIDQHRIYLALDVQATISAYDTCTTCEGDRRHGNAACRDCGGLGHTTQVNLEILNVDAAAHLGRLEQQPRTPPAEVPAPSGPLPTMR